MKNTSLVLSLIALAAVAAMGIIFLLGPRTGKKANAVSTEVAGNLPAGAVVYFNMDEVLENYDMANDLRSVVQTKVQGISDEINRRGNKLQADYNAFQDKLNKGLLTSSVAQVQGQDLQNRQNKFNNYANQKQQEIAEEQTVMQNQILEAIRSFVEKYNQEKQYSMIIATQSVSGVPGTLTAPVVQADTTLDITKEILAGLNDEYIKSKSSEKNAPATPTPATTGTEDKE